MDYIDRIVCIGRQSQNPEILVEILGIIDSLVKLILDSSLEFQE
jgi:hypothetical protein